MVGSCHGILRFHFFIFCLEATVKKNTWMRTISVTVMIIISKVLFWKLLDFSYVQLSFSTTMRHIDNGIWKIFYSWRLTWINIQANSFLGKYHEMKMGEGGMEIISCTKIRVYSLKNIAPGHFTYYRIVLCLSNNGAFTFFIRTSKVLMRLNVFFQGFQSQSVLIVFLLSMKH